MQDQEAQIQGLVALGCAIFVYGDIRVDCAYGLISARQGLQKLQRAHSYFGVIDLEIEHTKEVLIWIV